MWLVLVESKRPFFESALYSGEPRVHSSLHTRQRTSYHIIFYCYHYGYYPHSNKRHLSPANAHFEATTTSRPPRSLPECTGLVHYEQVSSIASTAIHRSLHGHLRVTTGSSALGRARLAQRCRAAAVRDPSRRCRGSLSIRPLRPASAASLSLHLRILLPKP